IDGVEFSTVRDKAPSEFLRQVAGMDLMALLAGDGGGDRVGLDADDLPVAGASQHFQEGAVVAADVDRPSRILAGECRGDQILEVLGLLESRRIGVRLAIDQVRRNGVDDLQQTTVLAALEADGESRVRIVSLPSEIVRDRKTVQLEKERE